MGVGGRVVCELAHKELDIFESEGVLLDVGTAFELFSWDQEEE